MKYLFVAIAIILSFVLPTFSSASAQSIDDTFAWLEGDWVRQTTRGAVTESWHRVSPNTMEGIASIASDGATRVSEHLRIEHFGDDVFFVAKPAENPFPTPFHLIKSGETSFVFENPDHDFPERIIYTRNGAKGLTVRIEGKMDEEVRGIVFEFEKSE